MNKLLLSAVLSFLLTLPACAAEQMSCVDTQDTYSTYDNDVNQDDINDLPSEYYVLSYSWAPGHCDKVQEKDKKPEEKDYLQCGSGAQFGYILHGLWPQGKLDDIGNWPRACEGDQPKIDRKILEKYLCMTPSVWLLQHEYEYHGTCMHDEALETPEAYFDTAMKLHSQLKLPEQQLDYTTENIDWWVAHNPHLSRESIQYYHKDKEWQFCYDNNFQVMACPNKPQPPIDTNPEDCPVKGNISNNSGNKYYFTTSHPQYADVKITPDKGEQCFATEQEAISAGWAKAPGHP